MVAAMRRQQMRMATARSAPASAAISLASSSAVGRIGAVAVDLRVVGHAGDVGARRVEPGRGGLADDSRHRDGREHAGRLGDVGLADVAALGPGICRQLLLVQRLQRVQRFLRGEARARRCVALQPGEVVELGRAALLLPALDLQDRRTATRRPHGRGARPPDGSSASRRRGARAPSCRPSTPPGRRGPT